ncbi:MAG TPA: hypothetical protein EYH05_00200, partial [Anaerolineae bacterium]|nr:hypothetical protein [Anaerolineae bacterium]
ADTLIRLLEAEYPTRDYFETAVRLGKQDLGDRTVTTAPYQPGDKQTFYDGDKLVEATLIAATDHTYFWVDDSLDLPPARVQAAADRFETEYYGRLTNLFGDVWSPGMDNDPHISILHTGNGTDDELGRFNSDDEHPRTLYDRSNEQEIIYMNMNELRLGSDLYYGTLVHEVQHLIQWYVDAGETRWLNEGLSQLAEVYTGFDDTATTIDYLENPEISLNDWDFDNEYPYYAASYLYSVYIWEQLGDEAIKELSRHPANGLASVYAILQGYRPDTTLEQFTAAWAAANYLDNPDAGPRYNYESLNLRRPSYKESVLRDETLDVTHTLEQFGVHYIDLNKLRGETIITFAGDTTIPLMGNPPTGSPLVWYAPVVDMLDASLTIAADLTQLDQATLKYNVWYDLEDEYDYGYVSISTDDGNAWDLLVPDHHTIGEFGPAYNGRSAADSSAGNGWLKESISLNSYVGNNVLVRFEVLTDDDITGQGMALDYITIPELDWTYELAGDTAVAQTEGFIPSGTTLPQQWSVQFIEGGPNPTVTPLPLNALNQGQWTMDIGKSGGVLVIMPQTPFVNESATYWLNVSPAP